MPDTNPDNLASIMIYNNSHVFMSLMVAGFVNAVLFKIVKAAFQVYQVHARMPDHWIMRIP